ncbi:MAG TPA: hypothetical protein VL688_08585 [Verrucomicrobiae bacterium]|nr:hypothetical protein [Verrucomicrobiae bacterium]
MTSFNLILRRSGEAALLALAFCLTSVPARAAETLWSRDADVDAALTGPSSLSSSSLPATGTPAGFNPLPAFPTGAGMTTAALAAHPGGAVDNASRSDGKAEVFGFKGKARIMKKGTEYWTPVYKGMIVQAGDKVLTYDKSSVSVRYDKNYKNLLQVESGTVAEFRSIEPTDIHLEKGTLFHYLDALVHGKSYRVSTDTVSMGVRGTYWVSSVVGDTTSAGTIPNNDDHQSEIEMSPLDGGEGVEIPEGKQLDVNGNNGPDQDGIRDLDKDVEEESHQIFEQFSSYDPNFNSQREQNQEGATLPPTSGSGLDAGGENVGQNDTKLDPLLDTQSAGVEQSSEPELPPEESHEPPPGGGCQIDGTNCE